MSLSDEFMDEAYDLRRKAEEKLSLRWQSVQHYIKYYRMLDNADALFEAGVCLKKEE